EKSGNGIEQFDQSNYPITRSPDYQIHDLRTPCPQVLVEKVERPLPRELGRLFVVARRRVVVEPVLRALVDEHLVLLVVRLQRRLEGGDSLIDAGIVARVVQHDAA